MKDWQCGIELDDLLEQEKIWERYNKVCLSPFLEQKKHRIASAIEREDYVCGLEWAVQSRILKVKTKNNYSFHHTLSHHIILKLILIILALFPTSSKKGNTCSQRTRGHKT